jgi:hypothetical protein
MTQITRRNLLKTGLAATAGLIASDKIFATLNVDTATPALESFPELPPVGTEFDTLKSLREVLLLDFGWRFHLGNADDGQQWQSMVSGFDASGFDNDNYGDFQAARPALSAIGSGNAHFSDFRYNPL